MLKNLFVRKTLESVILNNIEFKVRHTVKKNMRRMILRVEDKNIIKISSNKTTMKKTKEFILEHSEWILDRHIQIKTPFEENSTFYYLAKEYKVKHHKQDLFLHVDNVFLHVEKAKLQTDNFYKKRAKEYLPKRVEFWQKEMNLEFTKLGFRLAKKRWGSCNSKGTITLNPYLMKLNLEMIDYVIVHELSHLIHMNHSKAFYNHIESYIKNYIVIQSEIKILSLKLN